LLPKIRNVLREDCGWTHDFNFDNFQILFERKMIIAATPLSEIHTSESNPIYFLEKHIKDGEKFTDFFRCRNLNSDSIINCQSFGPLIRNIKANGYDPDEAEFLSWEASWRKSPPFNTCKANKKFLVKSLLLSTFRQEEPYLVNDEYKINDVPLDISHVILHSKRERTPILVTDSNNDIVHKEDILHNFDQLRRLSMSLTTNRKCFYGIATTLREWAFLCYIKPEDDEDVRKSSFLVSFSYTIQSHHKGKIETPVKKEWADIVRMVRGVLVNDVDALVPERMADIETTTMIVNEA